MALQPHPDSLLGRLAQLPDPRGRDGRRYPLATLLGLVCLGVLHGHDSLHSAHCWARTRWRFLWRPLGAHSPHFPCYNTVRNLLRTLDADVVDQHLRPWVEDLVGHPLGGISADGKVLRGSKRDDVPALHLVALVAHTCGSVLAQRVASAGDEVAALQQLLQEVPLRGRIITTDAGLTYAETTQTIRRQHGDYVGVIKGNHAEVCPILDDWVAEAALSPPARGGHALAGPEGGDCPTETEEAHIARRQPPRTASAASPGCGNDGEIAGAAGDP